MTKPTLKSFQKPALAALILLAMAWMPLSLSLAAAADAQPAPVPPAPDLKHEASILYGPPGAAWMVMDVFAPKAHANGKGIVFMVSGGFFSGPKLLEAFRPTIQNLASKSGYTFFAVQHGPQPDFVVSEIYPQLARAVRFIRLNARRFGVDPGRLGVIGFSSGGYCSLMRGVTGDDGNPAAPDPVERVSSRVQAVVSFYPPTDFLNYGAPGVVDIGTLILKDYRWAFIHKDKPPQDEKAMGRSVSPVYYVSADDAPTLLIHGDKDSLVPFQQSEIFLKAMKKAGVECHLRAKQGANHGWPDMEPDLNAALQWFDTHLGVATAAPTAAPKKK